MSKSKIFIALAVSFAIGVLLASAFELPENQVYVALAILAALFALLFLSGQKLAALVIVCLFSAGLGMLRLEASNLPNEYENLLGTKQELKGYVVEEPSIKNNLQTITFEPENHKQTILITTTLSQEFFYGDLIVAQGKIDEAKNFSDFDYQKYLQRFNTYAVMGYPKVLILKSHQLNPIKERLLKIKQLFISQLANVLREPQNSLAVGILIGGHGNLPKQVVDNFNLTGTSHIIAVSGFNITIIISALASLAFLIGRRASFYLALLALLSFTIITGASASVVRAAIMGFLLLLSLNIGRQYAVVPALFFAGLIMLIINPKILFWDVGFQLSFAATLGIIYFLPVFQKLTQRVPESLGIKTLMLTTISAILATLPIILFNFGTLSLSAPIVNVLVLPAVPFAMLFGFFSVVPYLGPGLALPASWLLSYILKITEVFAKLPYSSLNFTIPLWLFWLLISGVFGVYFLLLWLGRKIPAMVDLEKKL